MKLKMYVPNIWTLGYLILLSNFYAKKSMVFSDF